MLFVVRDSGCERCFCGFGGEVWLHARSPILKTWTHRRIRVFPSKLLTIDYSPYSRKKDVFLRCVFFPPECAHGAHKYPRMCTHQTPDLVFLLSRRSMNKTGAQRLSEEQGETRDVAGRSLCSSGGLFVPQSPCLDLQDYSSLDADCSENSHSSFFFFFFFWLTCLCKHARANKSIGDRVRTHLCSVFWASDKIVSGMSFHFGCF